MILNVVHISDPRKPKAHPNQFKSHDAAYNFIRDRFNSDMQRFAVYHSSYVREQGIPYMKQMYKNSRKLKYQYEVWMTRPQKKKFRRQLQRKKIRYNMIRVAITGTKGGGITTYSMREIMESEEVLEMMTHCFRLKRLGQYVLICMDSDVIKLNPNPKVIALIRAIILHIPEATLSYEPLTIYEDDEILPITFKEFTDQYRKVYRRCKDKSTFRKMGYPNY